MRKRRVVEMVEMFESPYSITIYGTDSSRSKISEDEVEDRIVSSPTPLLASAPQSPSSPSYN